MVPGLQPAVWAAPLPPPLTLELPSTGHVLSPVPKAAEPPQLQVPPLPGPPEPMAMGHPGMGQFDSEGVTAQRPPWHQPVGLPPPATVPSPAPGPAGTHTLSLLLLFLPETPTSLSSTQHPLRAGQPQAQPPSPPWQRCDQGSSSSTIPMDQQLHCESLLPHSHGKTLQSHKALSQGCPPAPGAAVPRLWSSPWDCLLGTKLLTTKTEGLEKEPRSLCKYILLKITALGENHTAGRGTQQGHTPLPMTPAHPTARALPSQKLLLQLTCIFFIF